MKRLLGCNYKQKVAIAMQFIVTVDKRGRITIPVELRRKLGWIGRMKVIFREVNGRLLIVPAEPKATGGKRQPSAITIPPAASPHGSR